MKCLRRKLISPTKTVDGQKAWLFLISMDQIFYIWDTPWRGCDLQDQIDSGRFFRKTGMGCESAGVRVKKIFCHDFFGFVNQYFNINLNPLFPDWPKIKSTLLKSLVNWPRGWPYQKYRVPLTGHLLPYNSIQACPDNKTPILLHFWIQN